MARTAAIFLRFSQLHEVPWDGKVDERLRIQIGGATSEVSLVPAESLEAAVENFSFFWVLELLGTLLLFRISKNFKVSQWRPR